MRRIARIEGHTDSVPLHSVAGIEVIGTFRLPTSVADYLLEKYRNGGGCIAGFGDAKPVAENESEPGRAANRRIEIVLPR